MPEDVTAESFADVWRREAPHVLAAVLRRYGDFGDCEDAVSDAAEAATRQWPVDGMPADPRGWLIRVAARRVIDRRRSDRARAHRETAHVPDEQSAGESDDLLQLLFLCCHPSLRRPSQVALSLRAVAGLSVEQIAAAYLVPARTMTQRLTRARTTLREAGARFVMPTPAEIPARVAAVLDACHLMFNEGYTRTSGEDLLDVRLADEAIGLTRRVVRALPADEAAGLLALMLLTHARTPARINPAGDLVPLSEQDRTFWRPEPMAEGIAILERILPRGPVGRYQLQAAIAAVHAEAPTWEATDWPQIAELYRMLDNVAPSHAVTLNRAVAVGMTDGPAAGLALLEPLLDDASMRRHHRVHGVRAHLLELSGDPDRAADAYRAASTLTTSIPEQRYLNACLARLASA